MDHSREAAVGFVCAHGDAFELFELTEEILDQMTPFIHLLIDLEGLCTTRVLRDDGLGATFVDLGDYDVAVESLVGDQRTETNTVNKRWNTDRVEAMTGQENETYEIAERVGEGEDFGRHASLGTAYGLILSPPLAPWPWRWTLTMVASTMAYSMSGSSEQASKSLVKTSALTQSR